MQKRKIIIGSYDTGAEGWTLTSWSLSAAKQKTNYVDKAGGDGSWDLSTALTDGLPRYSDRTFGAVLERSDGDRLSRKAAIRQLVNQLDGMRVNIVLPDDPGYYLTGRVHVAPEFNDMAHARVEITATCEPWLYSAAEAVVLLTLSTTKKTATLANNGRRALVPTITVSGNITLEFGDKSVGLDDGTFQVPDLLLRPGATAVTYSGSGSARLTYREAVLE